MDTKDIPFINTILFNLNTLITPKIVKIFYLAGMGAIVLKFVQAIVASFSMGFFNGLAGIFAATAVAIFSFLFLRIAVEFIIVFFKNNEALMEMSDATPVEQNIFEDVRDSFNDLFQNDDEDDLDLDIGEPEEPVPTKRPRAKATTTSKPRQTRAKPKAKPAAKPATRPRRKPQS